MTIVDRLGIVSWDEDHTEHLIRTWVLKCGSCRSPREVSGKTLVCKCSALQVKRDILKAQPTHVEKLLVTYAQLGGAK